MSAVTIVAVWCNLSPNVAMIHGFSSYIRGTPTVNPFILAAANPTKDQTSNRADNEHMAPRESNIAEWDEMSLAVSKAN